MRRLSAPSAGLGAVLLALVLTLSGCATAQSLSPTRSPAVAVPAPPTPAVDSFARLLNAAHDLGVASTRQPLSFLLLLRDPTRHWQQTTLTALYTPHSPRFGHFTSARDWSRHSGPSESAVVQLQQWLARRGLATYWRPGDTWLRVRGPAGRIATIFGTRVHRYRLPNGTRFWASQRDPTVPSRWRALILDASHLSTYANRRSQIAPVNGLTPTDLSKVYDVAPLRALHLNGAGQTIAFIEIDGYRQSDLNDFSAHFHLPPLHPILRYGGQLSNVDGEAEMDLEVVHELAPAARLTVYNCPGNCTDADIVQTEQAAVRDTPGGIISISLGGCEAVEGATAVRAEAADFTEADALGEAVLVASGDSGAFECLSQDWSAAPTAQYIGVSSPASVPGVTAVGGTRLSLHADGSWYREEAWENPAETAGTGGGVSSIFSRPRWQFGPGVATQGAIGLHRQVPDVAADADPLTAALVEIKGSFTEAGGTSQAAPIWAGITALMDQYLRQRKLSPAGFLNPALYTLARSPQPYPPFHDVTVGTNLVYPATPGYDLATGLGTPDAWNLARDLARYIAGGRR